MGRTLKTYRMRLNQIRDKYSRLLTETESIWVAAHRLSAPASTFPWPDTSAVAVYSVLVDIFSNLIRLEELHECNS